METPHIMDALRNWSVPNCFHVIIYLDPIGSDYIPQEYDPVSEEGALLEIPI